MEPEGSLPYSQVPATCPYPEPTPSSPNDPLQLPQHPSFCHFTPEKTGRNERTGVEAQKTGRISRP
jgi:hypothetical protein